MCWWERSNRLMVRNIETTIFGNRMLVCGVPTLNCCSSTRRHPSITPSVRQDDSVREMQAIYLCGHKLRHRILHRDAVLTSRLDNAITYYMGLFVFHEAFLEVSHLGETISEPPRRPYQTHQLKYIRYHRPWGYLYFFKYPKHQSVVCICFSPLTSTLYLAEA